MKKVELAIALVRTSDSGTRRWLVKRNSGGGKPGFIIGERLEKESCRETIAREVSWALDLDRKQDFLIANMAQMNLEFIDRLPGQPEKSHIIAAFYNVEVYRKKVLALLDADDRCFWIDSNAVCDGVTRKGQILNPIVPYLVNRSSVIQHWESQGSQ